MSVPPTGGWSPTPPPDSGHQGPWYPNPPTQQPDPGPLGPWPPQQGYPSPAPPRSDRVKWLLVGVVLVLVVGIAVTTTLLLRSDETGGNGTATAKPGSSSAPSDIASANDTGPVSIITVEPTCSAYYAINNVVADAQEKGWGNDRNSLGPASQWTPEQRTHIELASDAMRRAADQLVPLAKQTPHRVVRELYEQLIAYWRAYVAAVPTYTPNDNYLADATVNASFVITALCNAITYGSAPLVTGVAPVSAPTAPRSTDDPANPKRFITVADSLCKDWVDRQAKFAADSTDWEKIPPGTPGSQWTPEERAANEAVFPIMLDYADATEKAGRSSGNPVLEDFAGAAAIYLRALVAVGTNYVEADGWLATTALRLVSFVSNACRFVGTK